MYGFGLDGIAEPWEDNTRAFANGDVRLTMLAFEDPGAAPFHLVLLYRSQERDDMEGRKCVQINGTLGGFYAMDFQDLEASYDAAIGLIFRIPAEIYDVDAEAPKPVLLEVTYNQSTEDVKARYR